MSRIVSAADANRRFSDLLGRAAGGETVIITKRGTPVARLVPYADFAEGDGRKAAWDRLLATLEDGLSLGGSRFDRDARYDR